MPQNNFIDENCFKIGDHLIVERTCFTHHGIYAGSGLVIENRLELGIIYMPLSTFADNSEVRVRQHPYAKYNGLQALERAQSRLGEKAYNLVTFNCEHFVNWCIEGVETSRQVDNTLTVLAPFSSITDNLPIIGELTKEARQKAMAGHLATNPNDHETSAHFDTATQIRQFKEDITGNKEHFANGIEAIFGLAERFCNSVDNVNKYVDAVQLEKEAADARNVDDLFNAAQRLHRQQNASNRTSGGRHVVVSSTYSKEVSHSTQIQSPVYDSVEQTMGHPKGQQLQSSYAQTSRRDVASLAVEIQRKYKD